VVNLQVVVCQWVTSQFERKLTNRVAEAMLEIWEILPTGCEIGLLQVALVRYEMFHHHAELGLHMDRWLG